MNHRALPAWLLSAALSLCLTAGASAATPDPATQQLLSGLFDSYSKAVTAGNLDAAMTVMSKKLRKRAASGIKTAKDRSEMLMMARAMTPDTVEVVHSFINPAGTEARLVTVASKTIPKDQKDPDGPPPGSVVRNGMTLSFVKEGGAWKMDEQLFGGDPTEVKGCKSETNDPRDAYDPDKTTSAGGPIARVDFKPDYTMIVFTIVGDASCVFLPPKAELEKAGVDPASLVPYAIVEMDGIPHRTDPQKMLADSVKVQPEE